MKATMKITFLALFFAVFLGGHLWASPTPAPIDPSPTNPPINLDDDAPKTLEDRGSGRCSEPTHESCLNAKAQ